MENIGVVEQWRVECILNGFRYAVFSFAEPSRHNGDAPIFEYGADISEVEIDDAVHGDDFGYRASCYREGVVGAFKGTQNVEVGIDLAETFVVDNE